MEAVCLKLCCSCICLQGRQRTPVIDISVCLEHIVCSSFLTFLAPASFGFTFALMSLCKVPETLKSM